MGSHGIAGLSKIVKYFFTTTFTFYFEQDYEFQKSEEAKFVKDLDKFEMILQAHEYEKQSERPGHLQEFFDSTEGE